MANDTELIKSFIWSKTQTNLSKLLKEYSLPQIVRIVDTGFCSKNEYTNLHEEQILALHEIRSVRKLIATDSSDTQVAITLSCPAQVLVCPSNCKYKACKVENFKSTFPNIQYVRVKSQGPQLKNNDSALKAGDILQIQKIDKKKKIVLCQNTDTKEDITLSYKSSAIFTPLLDCQKYTPSEVVTKYGLPSRVYFVSTCSQADQTSDEWNSALTGLTEVVFHKEITEVKVSATVVGEGVGELMHCIGLPTDLPIRCTVAEGFSKSSESYEDFVRSLHAGFDNKSLLERVNVFQEISRANEQHSSKSTTTVSRPQPYTLPRLVRSIVATSHPQVSPDPDKRTIMNDLAKSPKDPLSDPKQSLQSPPEDSASTSECNYVQMENEEENHYKKASCEKQNISVDTQNDHPMKVKNHHLTPNVNDPSTPDVQKPQCIPKINPRDSDSYEEVNIIESQCNQLKLINSKHSSSYEEVNIIEPQRNPLKINSGSYEEVNIMEPQRNPLKINSGSYEEVNIMEPQRNRLKINSSSSNGYEEVKPAWNSNFKHEFADPSLILNKQVSEVYSDYAIPKISSKLQPQTQKFADLSLVLKQNDGQLGQTIPMLPPNIEPQSQQFANPNLVLNEQLSKEDSDYVIPIKASNLQRQAKEFVIHKRTDKKGKSIPDIYENVKCELPDKHAYEDMNPKLEFRFQEVRKI